VPEVLPVTLPVNVPTNPVAVILPVLGLYVKVPSDSRPKLPPSTSPPAVNIIALFSFVDSLSVIVTVVATVATSAGPVTSPVISPTNAVDVILVAPVTTPASITIVPSRTIC
jgi:hypothetical protein